MSAQQFSERSFASLPPASVQGTVACEICRAYFAPSQSHAYLVQAPQAALESALMSMCHFCFRCRRPSCPECWDAVHGLCASCVQELQLPFRKEISPLRGVLSSPVRHAQQTREASIPDPLVCIQTGTFQHSMTDIANDVAIADEDTRIISTVANEQENVSQSLLSDDKPTAAPVTPLPAMARNAGDVDLVQTRPDRTRRKGKAAERLVTILLLILLLFIIGVIAASLLSANVNAWIATTVHIDIRAEIAYLWQIISHL